MPPVILATNFPVGPYLPENSLPLTFWWNNQGSIANTKITVLWYVNDLSVHMHELWFSPELNSFSVSLEAGRYAAGDRVYAILQATNYEGSTPIVGPLFYTTPVYIEGTLYPSILSVEFGEPPYYYDEPLALHVSWSTCDPSTYIEIRIDWFADSTQVGITTQRFNSSESDAVFTLSPTRFHAGQQVYAKVRPVNVVGSIYHPGVVYITETVQIDTISSGRIDLHSFGEFAQEWQLAFLAIALIAAIISTIAIKKQQKSPDNGSVIKYRLAGVIAAVATGLLFLCANLHYLAFLNIWVLGGIPLSIIIFWTIAMFSLGLVAANVLTGKIPIKDAIKFVQQWKENPKETLQNWANASNPKEVVAKFKDMLNQFNEKLQAKVRAKQANVTMTAQINEIGIVPTIGALVGGILVLFLPPEAIAAIGIILILGVINALFPNPYLESAIIGIAIVLGVYLIIRTVKRLKSGKKSTANKEGSKQVNAITVSGVMTAILAGVVLLIFPPEVLIAIAFIGILALINNFFVIPHIELIVIGLGAVAIIALFIRLRIKVAKEQAKEKHVNIAGIDFPSPDLLLATQRQKYDVFWAGLPAANTTITVNCVQSVLNLPKITVVKAKPESGKSLLKLIDARLVAAERVAYALLVGIILGIVWYQFTTGGWSL
jgi:hypothetical protein